MTLGDRLALLYGPEVRDAVAESPEALAIAPPYFPGAGDPLARLLALRAKRGRACGEVDRADLRLLDDGSYRALAWVFFENRP